MDPDWIRAHTMGGNTYLLTQQLIGYLKPFKIARILDLGCGRCLSSVLLAEQLGAEVWAIDKHQNPHDNYLSVRQRQGGARIIPLQLDATNLPFPEAYFDCIVAVNAIYYFGTDDKFLPYISRFLQPGGLMAVTDICFTREVSSLALIPAFLRNDYPYFFQHLHALDWWQHHWAKTGLLDILVAENSPDSHLLKAEYIRMTQHQPDAFTKALEQDQDHALDFFALIGRKNARPPFLEDYRLPG